jgi:hypothetical protein
MWERASLLSLPINSQVPAPCTGSTSFLRPSCSSIARVTRSSLCLCVSFLMVLWVQMQGFLLCHTRFSTCLRSGIYIPYSFLQAKDNLSGLCFCGFGSQVKSKLSCGGISVFSCTVFFFARGLHYHHHTNLWICNDSLASLTLHCVLLPACHKPRSEEYSPMLEL